MMTYHVYILCNKRRGTLYIGVTNALERRLAEHRHKTNPNCFTAKYNVHRLVYAESCLTALEALEGEKRLKRWHRQWKIDLIEKTNPEWKDLLDSTLPSP